VIDRYSRPEMRKIWSDERKFQIWLEIELLACEAMAELGQIPRSDAAEIRKRARFSIPEILEIEKRTNHDVIAFLENVAESVGPAARWIHQGLTSSDILDTTLAVQLTESSKILLGDIEKLRSTIADQARRFKMTPMIGRSHGIHAEPITFGLKMALMYDEFGRAEERLKQTLERVRVGKLSGAVGTHAHVDPKIERRVCEKLGLKPATISTQIVQRDRHAEFMTTLAGVASSIDRWATEFRHLQRTEVLEVEEFFAAGQKGSSAMPHKRNPITGERLSGLARVIRGNAVVALENVALWHERDISHSSANHSAGFVHAAGLHVGEAARLGRRLAGLSGANAGKSRADQRFVFQPIDSARAHARGGGPQERLRSGAAGGDEDLEGRGELCREC
jgi:adenylosuccinate lyase